jgi:hypothetical protein
MEAHSLNKNQVGVYDETVNMLAAILTPEGMDPATKDLEKVKEEILALPFGFIIRVMGDLGELGSSMKKASS